ncbi:EF-hand domain-containing protein [Bradyrhizobium roseum]|uniref:EF-hand domain-containing protein n=1 Tax=Bradyrhizobium roseum TaxID=3056648 RepID=UPI00262AF5D9|nr:EF-hand domain-containing protein [Bradyrhizobium roseus]WKA30251.1 EF-hand domain-containing protein [Bradyrhizobium roseus]
MRSLTGADVRQAAPAREVKLRLPQLGGAMQRVSGVPGWVVAGILMAALNVPVSAPGQQAAARPPLAVPGALAPDSPPRASSTLERYFASLHQDFVQLDADLDGMITQRDVDLHVLMETVVSRTFALQFVMGYDLDGDGAVTEDEIRRAMKYRLRSAPNDPEAKISDTVRSTMALDTDGDGKVSASEAGKFTYPDMKRDLGFPELPACARRILMLESRTKGEIAWSDYEAAGEKLFRRIDTDKDGKISRRELDDCRGGP